MDSLTPLSQRRLKEVEKITARRVRIAPKKHFITTEDGREFGSLDYMMYRVLPTLPCNAGDELAKIYETKFNQVIEYGSVEDDMTVNIGIWAYDAGQYWPIMKEKIEYYSMKSYQGDFDITQQLVKFFDDEEYERHREIIQEERLDFIVKHVQPKSIRWRCLRRIEEKSYQHFIAVLSLVEKDVKERTR